MYVTFDYCVIIYSTVKPQFIKESGEEIDDDDDSTKVYMDKVISLRTDVRSPIPDCGVSDCLWHEQFHYKFLRTTVHSWISSYKTILGIVWRINHPNCNNGTEAVLQGIIEGGGNSSRIFTFCNLAIYPSASICFSFFSRASHPQFCQSTYISKNAHVCLRVYVYMCAS